VCGLEGAAPGLPALLRWLDLARSGKRDLATAGLRQAESDETGNAWFEKLAGF
jgi:hypothetical protein